MIDCEVTNECRDKVYCTLTGQLIGMGRFFLQMHVDGKKYRKAKGLSLKNVVCECFFVEAFLENRSHLKPEPEITDLIVRRMNDIFDKKCV